MSAQNTVKKNGPDDKSLIAAFLEGDEGAFDVLVARYRDMVFNLCFRYLNDYDEADECAQQVFIKMYRGLGSFRMESALPTWLYRIAVNTCKNRITMNTARNRRETCGGPACRGDSSCDPSGLFENNERQRRIQEALAALPPGERLMIVLKDMEGKTYVEIEEITGVREGTVKSTLSRTRKKMRMLLKDIFP